MKEKEFIQKLNADNSVFHSIRQAEMLASLLDTVSKDIYSESQRFVFELIQNADDAATHENGQVHFEFIGNYLIVSHNGKAFDEQDIIGLTGAGASTKVSDAAKTGYKGIGFKSVFGQSKNVFVFSNGYQFRFSKSSFTTKMPWQVIPIWTEFIELPEDVAKSITSKKPNVATIIEVSNRSELETELESLLSSGELLLFLRRISHISVVRGNKSSYDISKDIKSRTSQFDEVSIKLGEKLLSDWIIKRFDNIPVPDKISAELKMDDNTPEKLKDSKHTEIVFAAKINKNKITQVSGEKSLIFTFLPTKVTEFQFPFLVNGSFVTNASRETLHQDQLWNQWLFKVIAEKLTDWFELLAESQHKFQILSLIPDSFQNSSNQLKTIFDQNLNINISSKKFIISKGNQICSGANLIHDKTGLSELAFIPSEAVVGFVNSLENKTFKGDCFVNSNTEEVSKLKRTGVTEFSLEDLSQFFISEHFIENHKVNDNFDLIKFLKSKSDSDKQGIWFQTLLSLPFILDENNILRCPSNDICFPIGVATTELGNIPVMHDIVFKRINGDKSAWEWLRKLGVKEPSNVVFVTNVVVPGIKKGNFIDSTNYIKITHFLFRLFNANSLESEVLESLRELPIKVKREGFIFKEAQSCFLSNFYRPQLTIEGTISADVEFVSEDYVLDGNDVVDWYRFFKALKVKDQIEIEVINDNNSLPALMKITSEEWVNECRKQATKPGAFGYGDHNIIKNVRIPSFLNLTAKNYLYSKLFWKSVLADSNFLSRLLDKATYCYGVGYGQNRYISSVENYFTWFIRNKDCLPTSIDKLMPSNFTYVNDKEIVQIAGKHLPVIDFEGSISPEWKQILGLKNVLTVADYLQILTNISDKAEDEESAKKPSLKRIGLIYNKLATIISGLTELEVKTISDWAQNNKVLSSNGEFIQPNQLKWITIEGFKIDTETIKLIDVPENCDFESDNFRTLLNEFGVQVIDHFEPTFTDRSIDDSLKFRIGTILPIFAAVLEKRQLLTTGSEYPRLFEIVNNTIFYTAKEIKLSFTHNGNLVNGPGIITYFENNEFSFKGRWKSERTLLYLIKELTDLLNVDDFEQELRFLLLEDSSAEIEDWLKDVGILFNDIQPKKEFKVHITEAPNLAASNNNSIADNIKVNEGHHEVNQATTTEVFNPTVNFEDITTTFSKPKIRSSNINPEHNPIYNEIRDDNVRTAIGRWSEMFVSKNLQQWVKFEKMEWLNEKEESGKPYDFTIVQNGTLKYIEVKGTPSSDKSLVYLSPNEWNWMLKHGENYILIRIYSAGESYASSEIISNPSKCIEDGTIQVALRL